MQERPETSMGAVHVRESRLLKIRTRLAESMMETETSLNRVVLPRFNFNANVGAGVLGGSHEPNFR